MELRGQLRFQIEFGNEGKAPSRRRATATRRWRHPPLGVAAATS